MLKGSRRPFTLAKGCRHLGVTQTLDEPQQHDLALLLAQLPERAAQLVDLQLLDVLGLRVARWPSAG